MEHTPPEPVLALAEDAARRHHLHPDRIHPLPAGEANHVLALGEHLLLRVPRTPEHAHDLAKEAEILPLAHAAGLPVPHLIEHHTTPRPHMIQTLLPGHDLHGHHPTTRLLTELGHHLAHLHRLPTRTLTRTPHQDDTSRPHTLIRRLHHTGHLDPDTAHWLHTWYRHLETHLPPHPPETVLIHGDLTPANLLTGHDGTLTGIVDWGDAALADPAVDFAKLPPHRLTPVLNGYLTTLDHEDSDLTWRARILHHQLTWALARLKDPHPHPDARHWSAPPHSRLLGLLRLFATRPDPTWRALTPPG
ncbi:phosphotransferase [Nocardiopsis alba]|uniref:phosphotransferase family protein n=1 Tax=Nocardiopsis alba TaxID=53437 RepID=UPI0034014BC5